MNTGGRASLFCPTLAPESGGGRDAVGDSFTTAEVRMSRLTVSPGAVHRPVHCPAGGWLAGARQRDGRDRGGRCAGDAGLRASSASPRGWR